MQLLAWANNLLGVTTAAVNVATDTYMSTLRAGTGGGLVAHTRSSQLRVAAHHTMMGEINHCLNTRMATNIMCLWHVGKVDKQRGGGGHVCSGVFQQLVVG